MKSKIKQTKIHLLWHQASALCATASAFSFEYVKAHTLKNILN